MQTEMRLLFVIKNITKNTSNNSKYGEKAGKTFRKNKIIVMRDIHDITLRFMGIKSIIGPRSTMHKSSIPKAI